MFSVREELVLKKLTTKPQSIRNLAKKLGIDNNRTAAAIRSINVKCKLNKLKWIVDAEGGGRGGKTVWVRGKK